jgi:outer membrane lipoprotein-sorting protein
LAAKVALLALLAAASSLSAQNPQDGRALLERMRSAYAGKWFKTVTFVQQTIRKNPQTNVTDTTTWYEALKAPDRLRIDFGDPKSGNGVVYTADSLYVVRGDTVRRTVPSGNPFLPFVMGVYAQPLDTTLRQIASYKFDLTKLYTTTWQGRPTYVAGSQSAADTISPQFWIDQERLVVVRMLVALNPAAPTDVADIRLDDYRPVAGGWLAVRVAIMRGGQVIQKEDYSDWRGNVDIPDDFFVAQKWGAVPHWHR